MDKLPSPARLISLALLLTCASLGCALLAQPTPITLPTPSATPEVFATETPSPNPTTATAQPGETATPTSTPSPTQTTEPPTPTTEPPTATWTPEPSPTATLPPEAVRVAFNAGATSATVTDSLAAGDLRTYVLSISEGQLIDLVVTPQQNVQMEIRGADGAVVSPLGQPYYRGTVPSTQDYLVTLSAPTVAVDVTLNIIIPVRITFAPGGTTAQLTATLPPFTTGHYVIRAQAGQTMTVDTTTTQGEVITIVYGADGAVLQTDHAGAPDFTGILPSTQDYLIDLRSVGSDAAVVTIDIEIPPPP